MAGFMSGFARGFSRVFEANQDRKFRAEEAEKDRQAAEERMREQYRLQFETNVNLAKAERSASRDEQIRVASEYYDSSGMSNSDDPENENRREAFINKAMAHGGLTDWLKFDQDERRIQATIMAKQKPKAGGVIAGTALPYEVGPDGSRVKPGTNEPYTAEEIAAGQREQMQTRAEINSESAIDTSRSKEIRKEWAQEEPRDAQILSMYNTNIQALEKADTGMFAPLTLDAARFFKGLGVPLPRGVEDSIDARQKLTVEQMHQLVSAISNYPGAMSNKEMDGFLASVTNLTNEEDVNRAIVGLAYAMAHRRSYIRETMLDLIATEGNGIRNEAQAEMHMIRAMNDPTHEDYIPFVSNTMYDSRTGDPLLYAVFVNDAKNDYPEMSDAQIRNQWMMKHAN